MSENGDRRTVLVTGATQGIGAAIARRLAADDARVAVNEIDERPALAAIVEELGGLAAPADLTDATAVAAMVRHVVADFGGLDTLVCNAAYMTMAPFLEHDLEDWWKILDTNLTGTFRLIREALTALREHGRGRVVVVASNWGVVGWPNATAYAASKAGLIALVKTLGRELAPDVVVNGIAPGVTATPQLEVDALDAGVDLATMHERYARDIPLGRLASPAEIADAVALLVNPAVGAMIGQILQVNGGEQRCRV